MPGATASARQMVTPRCPPPATTQRLGIQGGCDPRTSRSEVLLPRGDSETPAEISCTSAGDLSTLSEGRHRVATLVCGRRTRC